MFIKFWCKILWDFNIYTYNIISARRPDIVLIDKQTKKTIIIDINCPADKNITKNEKEKINKYISLQVELERVWETKITIVPIVIGCLGSTTNNLRKYAERLSLDEQHIRLLQRETLLGSARIIRRYITQGGEHFV